MLALCGKINWNMGEFHEGASLIERAFHTALENYGERDKDTLNYKRELAMCKLYFGKIREAYEEMNLVYEVALEEYGENHTLTLKASQNLLTIGKELEALL